MYGMSSPGQLRFDSSRISDNSIMEKIEVLICMLFSLHYFASGSNVSTSFQTLWIEII